MAEGRYYWLKLKRDFFKRHDIRIVEAMPNGKDYILFYLKLLCESVDHEGRLRFSEQIPYSETMLATLTDTNVDIVRSAINVFSQLGMMEILDDGTFFMNEVQRMIGSAANNENANRVRRYRERQKELEQQEKYASVTKCNASVTKCNESKNKSKSKSIEIEAEERAPAAPAPIYELPPEFIADVMTAWNAQDVTFAIQYLRPMTQRYDNTRLCLQYTDYNGFLDVIRDLDGMEFFKALKTENRPLKYDQFVKPDFFVKVLEGNYREAHGTSAQEQTAEEIMAWAIAQDKAAGRS